VEPVSACSALGHEIDPLSASPSFNLTFSTDGKRVNVALTVNTDFS
jgi:hypothetical protein